jgi:hypothetical protein
MAAVFQALLQGPLISMMGSKNLGVVMWKPNKKVPEAIRYLEEGCARGKVVIKVVQEVFG